MPINPTEKLSRYIFTNNYFRADNSVKWQAFYPTNNETSVYRIFELSDPEIWDIGTNVGIISGRRLKGRADILTSSVLDVPLDVNESEPPPRHANIIGWPDEADRMQLAMELSEASQGFKI